MKSKYGQMLQTVYINKIMLFFEFQKGGVRPPKPPPGCATVADNSENVYQTYVANVSEILDIMRPTNWNDPLHFYNWLLTVVDAVM